MINFFSINSIPFILFLDAPKFLSPLKSYTVKELSSDIAFECEVKAKPDLGILYRWFFNGKELKHTDATLVRKIAKREYSGEYMCQAKNQVGSTNSSIGKLVVTCKHYPFISPTLLVKKIIVLTKTISVYSELYGSHFLATFF